MTFVKAETATRRERARQRLKVMKVQQMFGILQERDAHDHIIPPTPKVTDVLLGAANFGNPSGRGTPVRTHPDTPPVRDAFHTARHKRNKAARASRKRNRA